MKRETIEHPLEPVFDGCSRVLILGTMPSPASRAGAFYYAHPRNRFWPTVAALLGEPLAPDAEGRRALALRHGIALWDVLASCTIEGAGDASIRDPRPNDLAALLEKAPIKAVFCTGQTAGRLYHRLCEPSIGLSAHILPSPSPANCAMPLKALVERYRVLLPFLTGEW